MAGLRPSHTPRPQVSFSIASCRPLRRPAAEHAQLNPRRQPTSQPLALAEGNYHEAIQVSARGLIAYPHLENLAYFQAEALYQLGRYDAARDVLLRLINEPQPRRDAYLITLHDIKEKLAPMALAEIFRVQRFYGMAENVLQGILNQRPDDRSVWQFLGRVYIDSGDRQKFDAVLNQLIRCPGGDAFVPLLEAWWLYARGDWNSALEVIDRAIGKSSATPLIYLLRAECLMHAGASNDALLESYRETLRVQPKNRPALNMVSKLKAAQSNAENRSVR